MDSAHTDPERYDALLDLRHKETEECQRQLGAYLQALEALRAEARQRRDELQRLGSSGPRAGERLDLAEQGLLDVRRVAIEQELLRGEVRQQHAQDEIDGQRSVLTEAMRRERAVERLRERLHEAIEAETRRRERLELDEIGSIRHNRSAPTKD